jgi:hypothetical protein
MGLAGAPLVTCSLYRVTLPLLSNVLRLGFEATMKALVLALWLALSVYGVAIASESQHSVIVDMPEVATLTHASPDTWHTLPPVQPNDVRTTTGLLFAQVAPVEPTCDASPGYQSRNSLSFVEFF